MNTKNFLKSLCPVGKVEFNDLSHTIDFETALKTEKNIYFLASVENPNKRNSDKDVIHKNYFFIDFDLRKNFQDITNELLSDKEMVDLLGFIKDNLNRAGYGDYRYIVNTGNGFHFYYVGEGKAFESNEYKTVIEHYYNDLDSKLNDALLKIDKSCKNIGRISRLPGTKNYSRKDKFGLEPSVCEILEDTGIVSEKIKNISEIYKQLKEKSNEDTVKKEIKRQMLSINDDTLEHIINLDIVPLVEEYTGLELGKDGKNFPDKDGNTGMFVSDNVLIYTGTGRISDKFNGYNTFTFVREHHCDGDNNRTFEWFKGRYPQIKDISEKQKKQFKQTVKQQQIQESLSEDIWVESEDLTVDFSGNRPGFGLECIDNEFRKFDTGGELSVLFGPPGSGKTEFGFFVAKANRQYKTIVFCLEVTKKTILSRWALRRFGIRGEDVDNGRVSEYMREKVNNEILNFDRDTKDYLKMISIRKGPTVEQLIAKMEQEMDGQTIFIIDNLGKIQGDTDENVRFADITAKLQTFAYNNKSWVILQHHTVKPASSNKSKSIDEIFGAEVFGAYGFRGSQKVYDNATRMIEIHRNYGEGLAILFQYKHTPTDARGMIELEFKNGEYVEHKPYEAPF